MSTEEQKQGDDYDTLDPMLEETQAEIAAQQAKGEEALAKEESAETGEVNESEAAEAPAPESPVAEYDHPEETEPAEELPAGDDATDSGDGGQPETAEPEFDAALLADFNLTAEQAKAQFGTPEALANAGRLLDQRVLQNFQQVAQNPNQVLPKQPNGEVIIPQERTQTTNPEQAAEFEMPEPSDGEAWDEDVTRLVQSLNEHHAKQQKQLQAELEKQRQVTEAILAERQEIETRRYVDELDGFVNALGDEWTAVLGKGSGYDLGPQSPFVTARAQLDAIAQQLSHGRQVQGLPQLSRVDLLKKALPLAFPNIQQQVVRHEVEDELGKRERMKTNRPTGRRQRERRSPESAAGDRAEQWYAERGMAPLPYDDVDIEEI